MRMPFASRRRKASGICTMITAPSPVRGSQPHAPRCVRLRSTSSPCSTMSCDLSPFTLTTKPTPHASCSMRGSRSQLEGPWIVMPPLASRAPQVAVALAGAPRPLAVRDRRQLLGMQVHPDALRMRGQHDGRLGACHAVEGADLRDELLERGGARRLRSQEHTSEL